VIAPLTGVRAFAALWVVLAHLRVGSAHALALPHAVDLFCRIGYLGVDLFGLLSGFVIAHNYADRLAQRDLAATGRYLWLRAVRIVPLHWFAMALLAAGRVGLDRFEEPFAEFYGARDFFQQLFLVHGFGFSELSWNRPSWTVSSEWACYLAFPLFAPLLVRVRAGGVAAVLAMTTLAATSVAMHQVGYPGFNATADWGVVRIAGEFATGCFLRRAFGAGFARAVPWGAVAPLALVAAAVAMSVQSAAAIVASFAVLVYALAQQRGGLARLLATRPLVFLGDASYAIYILHFVVLRFFAHAVAGAPETESGQAILGRVALELAAILVAAIAAHLVIENPARRRLRRCVAPIGGFA
jgi:peptidoglycan/LPS O-acetylase OafA/YrhL